MAEQNIRLGTLDNASIFVDLINWAYNTEETNKTHGISHVLNSELQRLSASKHSRLEAAELPLPSETSSSASATTARSSHQEPDDPISKIGRLNGLLDAGALSQAEFDAKKAELLAKVR